MTWRATVGTLSWKLAIWLPPRDMGLKIARVLVFDGISVMPFDEYEEQGRRRGEEINDAHRQLWAISLFVDETVTAEDREEDPCPAGPSSTRSSGMGWTSSMPRRRQRTGPTSWPPRRVARARRKTPI